MIMIKYLSGNYFILAIMLVFLVPLPCLKATPVEFGDNLIRNPDAELGIGSVGGYDIVDVPEWNAVGNFTVVNYGAPKFLDFDSSGPDDRGINFFSGGPSNIASSAFQIIDVSDAAYEIDQGIVSYNLSGYFGGYDNHEDNATLTAVFQDSNGDVLGSAIIGQVSVSDRDTTTGLLFRDAQGLLPTNTRQVEVLLEMNRIHGAYNDGYADNLSFVLVPLPSTIILLGTGILAMRRYQRLSRRSQHFSINK